MSLVATLEALVKAGATPEMMLEVVRVHEASRVDALEQRRASDAARQERKRQRDNVTSRDLTRSVNGHADSSPHVGAPPQVVILPLPSLRSEEIAAAVVAREPADDWPDGGNKGHARLLVELIDSPWLDPSKSPDLVTTAGRLAAWKRDGASWEHDVVPVVSGLVAKRRQRIVSWKFFDGAMAQSIADNRAALDIPEAQTRPRGQGPPSLMAQISADHAEARRRVLEN